MKRYAKLLLALVAFCSLGAQGVTTYIYQTTDIALLREIETARRWKHFFLHAHEDSWAAFYAGVEHAYTLQYESFGFRVPREPVSLRPE